ncbi:MAG: hydrolase [Halobacteriota archaeon]|nr:hydrolase [Halobacteriota archaeon]
MNEDECCPKFDAERWDKRTFNWEDKPFIKESIPTFLHTPFPPMIWWKLNKMWKMAEEAEATLPNKEEILVLFNDPNAFKSEIYLSVAKEVDEAKNSKISGDFVSKVFDGPYNAIPRFISEMNEYLSGENKTAKDYYVHYAYCQKCAKKFGHNYMILFAEV